MILAVLSALADPTRPAARQILDDGDEHCFCDLMRRMDATQSRMSRHIQILQQAGTVADGPDAQLVRYRTRPDLPQRLRALLAGAVLNEVIA